MAKRDYYEVLGLSKTATEQEIRKAFRTLAMQYHPDRNKEAGAEAKFKEINEAYEVLSDPEKRKKYDQFGHAAFDQQAGRGQGGFEGFEGFQGGFRGNFQGFGGSDFEDIFSAFFGGNPRGPRRGEDVELQLTISFSDALSGRKLQQKIERIVDGRRVKDEITIEVPAGIETGQHIVLKGKGGEGVRGGPAGDMYIRIVVQQHKHYKREGKDLHLVVPVSAFDIVNGSSIEIPTPWGLKTMSLDTSLRSGDTKRLSGYGMPIVNGGSRRGDLVVHFQIYVPDLSGSERRAVNDAVRGLRDKTYDKFLKDFN